MFGVYSNEIHLENAQHNKHVIHTYKKQPILNYFLTIKILYHAEHICVFISQHTPT